VVSLPFESPLPENYKKGGANPGSRTGPDGFPAHRKNQFGEFGKPKAFNNIFSNFRTSPFWKNFKLELPKIPSGEWRKYECAQRYTYLSW
jgi:hypothetical protein